MELHATPYGIYDGFTGFYFKSYEDFKSKYDAWYRKNGCEEYEIQFIDGDETEQALFKFMKARQGNIKEIYEEIEENYSTEDLVKLTHLIDYCACSFEDAKDKLPDVELYQGKALDYVYQYIDECYSDMPAFCKRYFDYESYLNDLRCNSEVIEYSLFGEDWTITNALHI